MARRPAKKAEQKPAGAPVPVQREERHPLADLRADIDRLFDSFFHRFPSLPMGRGLPDWEPFWGIERGFGITAPRVDVTETDKGFQVVAELPGLEQKDISLELKDDVLTLSGEKKEEREEEKKDVYLSERRFGAFRRSFRLPSEIDQNKIAADFKNGVLTVSLPKTARAQKASKKIAIKS